MIEIIRYNLTPDGKVQEIGVSPAYEFELTDEPFTMYDSYKWQKIDGEWIKIIEDEEENPNSE